MTLEDMAKHSDDDLGIALVESYFQSGTPPWLGVGGTARPVDAWSAYKAQRWNDALLRPRECALRAGRGGS